MADKRTGFCHRSNKMRTKWEAGVQRNKEILIGKRALLAEWVAAGGWETQPEYMHQLEREVKKQEQYLRNRFGEIL